MLTLKAPAEQFGMSQIVSTSDVHSRTVISPPLEERCSLVPHPGCGSCTEEQALRTWNNTHLTHFKAPQNDGRKWFIHKGVLQKKTKIFYIYSFIDLIKYMCVYL